METVEKPQREAGVEVRGGTPIVRLSRLWNGSSSQRKRSPKPGGGCEMSGRG